ncbi:MAG: flagellar hook-associated protein FlgL [Thermoleophilia bacterium]
MSTRITNSMMTRTLLYDLQSVTERLARTQEKLSSGKELTRPSDDPFKTSRALQFRSELSINRQYQRNAKEASSWSDATDTALAQITEFGRRARDLIVQGASDSVGQNARDSIAQELTQIVDSIKTQANTQYAGRYVFSGSATLTRPYALGPSDAYAGNAEVVKVEVGPGVQVDLNTVGQSVIGDGAGGLLRTIRDAIADLQAGNGADLQTVDLSAMDTALDTITNARAIVGARQNRLESAVNRLTEIEESTSRLLSETEDADMAETLVHFSMQQAVYQSALKSGAQIIQPSLIDFLN